MRGQASEDAYERSARQWLRAFPPRWRAAREDEVVGVLLDTRPDGAATLGAAARWDLLRSAVAWRLRHRPPFVVWLLWRLGFSRMPEAHVGWALDDLSGRLYGLWSTLWSWQFLGFAVFVAPHARSGGWWWWLPAAVWSVALLLGAVGDRFSWGRPRRDERQAALLAPHRTADRVRHDPSVVLSTTTRWSWGRWLVAPVVVAWVSALVAVGVVVSAVLDGVVLRVRDWQAGDTLLLLPLAAGLVAAVTVTVLSRPRVAERPDQPWRHRVAAPPVVVRVLLLVVAVLGPWTAVQITLVLLFGRSFAFADGLGGYDFLVGVPAAPVTFLLLALPSVHLRTRGALAARPAPPPALHDVLGVLGGTTVLVDPPRPYPALPSLEPFVDDDPAAGTGSPARR
ncbi:hypothetical protein [Aquipuribacter sp. SD81]|uniref:hypothetical protein n=1 Tax=Aquipuribacter sp. SD81 TaxID=3127703 RepID=UPI0030159F29